MNIPAPLHIVVGSGNPVKRQAVEAVVRRWRPDARITHVAVPSGVSDQPVGDDETIRGAQARAVAARLASDADVGVGIEGGVVDTGDAMRTCAWAAVSTRDGAVSTGGSLSMPLPASVAALVRAGTELGHAMDAITDSTGTKHGPGAVGILTGGLIDRQAAYEVIVTYAFAPLLAGAYFEQAHPLSSV